MRTLLSLTLVMALAGCTGDTLSTYALNKETAERHKALAADRAHYLEQMNAPSFASIRETVDFTDRQAVRLTSCTGTASDRVPNADERAALQRWADLRANFTAQAAKFVEMPAGTPEKMAQRKRQYSEIVVRANQETNALIGELAAGRLTFCQYDLQDQAIVDRAVHDAGPAARQFRNDAILEYNTMNRPFDSGLFMPVWGMGYNAPPH